MTKSAIYTLSFALLFMLQPITVAGQQPTFKSVLEGARREGSLTVWVTSPGKAETHAALFKAFNSRFGISVKGQWSPTNAAQTGARLVAEQGRRQGAIDVVGAGGAEEAAVLLKRGLLKPYPWVEVFGKELPQIRDVANWGMPDLRNIALLLFDSVYGVAWNSDFIKDSEVPTKLVDLAGQKWQGKVAVNALFVIPFDMAAYAIGQDATADLIRRLIASRPVLERGTPAVARAVAIGQVPLGVTTFHAAARAGTRQKPLKFKLLADYIPVIASYLYIPENAPHPNAARLFAAWMVTEGLAVAEQFETLPRIGDANSPLGKAVKERTAAGSKILASPSLNAIFAHEAMRKRITDLLTGTAK